MIKRNIMSFPIIVRQTHTHIYIYLYTCIQTYIFNNNLIRTLYIYVSMYVYIHTDTHTYTCNTNLIYTLYFYKKKKKGNMCAKTLMFHVALTSFTINNECHNEHIKVRKCAKNSSCNLYPCKIYLNHSGDIL